MDFDYVLSNRKAEKNNHSCHWWEVLANRAVTDSLILQHRTTFIKTEII